MKLILMSAFALFTAISPLHLYVTEKTNDLEICVSVDQFAKNKFPGGRATVEMILLLSSSSGGESYFAKASGTVVFSEKWQAGCGGFFFKESNYPIEAIVNARAIKLISEDRATIFTGESLKISDGKMSLQFDDQARRIDKEVYPIR